MTNEEQEKKEGDDVNTENEADHEFDPNSDACGACGGCGREE